MSNPMDHFRAETVVSMLKRWAADQWEREGWGDEDQRVYRYRARLLDTAVTRLSQSPTPTNQGEPA